MKWRHWVLLGGWGSNSATFTELTFFPGSGAYYITGTLVLFLFFFLIFFFTNIFFWKNLKHTERLKNYTTNPIDPPLKSQLKFLSCKFCYSNWYFIRRKKLYMCIYIPFFHLKHRSFLPWMWQELNPSLRELHYEGHRCSDICPVGEGLSHHLGSKFSLGHFSNKVVFFPSLPQGAHLYVWSPVLSSAQYLPYGIHG